jgi:hypothetical protein
MRETSAVRIVEGGWGGRRAKIFFDWLSFFDPFTKFSKGHVYGNKRALKIETHL